MFVKFRKNIFFLRFLYGNSKEILTIMGLFFFFSQHKYFVNSDLLIYLRGSISTLVNQIHKRGRDYENSISIDYLSRLNDRYENWVNNYDKGKLLIIDIDNLNFVDKKEDLGFVIDKIEAEINGLF